MPEGVDASPTGGSARGKDFYFSIAIVVLGVAGLILFPDNYARLGSLVFAVLGGASAWMGVRNHQDFFGGIVLIAISVIALWATRELPGMHGFAFGPGTAPRMFSLLLVALGAVVSLIGLTTDAPPLEKYDIRAPALIMIAYGLIRYTNGGVWIYVGVALLVLAAIAAFYGLRGERHGVVRGPLLITISLLIFAEAVRPLGLVISTFVTLMVAAAGSEEVRWKESIIWAAVLTVFCSLLFPYALNLPLYLWPRF